jgi:hypothetical protein
MCLRTDLGPRPTGSSSAEEMNEQRDSRARILAVYDDRNGADAMCISLSTATYNVTAAPQKHVGSPAQWPEVRFKGRWSTGLGVRESHRQGTGRSTMVH